MKIIKVIEFANGTYCPFAEQYVKTFDFEARNGQGSGTFTPRVHEAMRFDTAAEAAGFWKRQSGVKPLRSDGQPNRPLTATTIEISDASHD